MNFSHKKIRNKKQETSFFFKVILLSFVFISMQFTVFSQVLKEIDVITPFQEELAAVKKGNAWAFVDKQGVMVINFRDDLVTSKTDDTWYPKFVEGKCMIKKMIDGELFYGYIDKEGTTVIEPKFLNATNFTDGFALIIKIDKSKMGTNTALGKKMINLKLEEYVIDSSGKIVKFLDNSRGYRPSNSDSKQAPKFKSKFIGPHLAAVKKNDGKWDVYKF